MRKQSPPHPGMLIADILEKGSLKVKSAAAFARHLGVSRGKLSRVIKGKTTLSADLALLLQDALGIEAEVWLMMQAKRNLWIVLRKKRKKIKRLVVGQPV